VRKRIAILSGAVLLTTLTACTSAPTFISKGGTSSSASVPAHPTTAALGPKNIRVNAIAPGFTTSDAGRRLVPDDSAFRQMLNTTAPLRAFGSPDDL